MLASLLGVLGCQSSGARLAKKPSQPPATAVEPAAYEAEATPPRPLPATDAEAPIADGLQQPAEVVPPPEELISYETTSLEQVVRSVIEYFPVIQQAAAGRGIASGQVLEASGAFDHKLEGFYESQPLDFYENHRGSIGIKRDTTWGGQTFAGYRIGRGVYEPWYLERETNKGGEFKAGFMAPLVRDRVIDANRAELWQAQVERTRVEALIQMAVIGATRDGSLAYWEWVAAGEKLRIAREVLNLGIERRDFLEKQIAAGEKKKIDRVDNRRIIVSREAKVVDAERKLRQAAAKLSLYLRGNDGRPLLVTGLPSPEPFNTIDATSFGFDESDIALAQTNRPEPRELDLVTQQLRIALRQACNETWPDVDAGLLVGQDVGEPTSSKRDKSEFELEAKLTVSVPLERRKAFGKVRQLRGKIAQVRAKQRLTLDKIAIDVQVAKAALEASARRVEQTTEAVELAEQLKVAEQRLFNAGQSDLFTLNLREKQAADAAVERVDALRDYHVSLADYAAALGFETNSLPRVSAEGGEATPET